jgi:hypothetical protein
MGALSGASKGLIYGGSAPIIDEGLCIGCGQCPVRYRKKVFIRAVKETLVEVSKEIELRYDIYFVEIGGIEIMYTF